MNHLDHLLEHGSIRLILAVLLVAAALVLVVVTGEGPALLEWLAFRVKQVAEAAP